eukprot:UN04363
MKNRITSKWRLYVHRATKMSDAHNKRMSQYTTTIITSSPFTCVDADGSNRIEVLVRFYKLSHSLGSFFVVEYFPMQFVQGAQCICWLSFC